MPNTHPELPLNWWPLEVLLLLWVWAMQWAVMHEQKTKNCSVQLCEWELKGGPRLRLWCVFWRRSRVWVAMQMSLFVSSSISLPLHVHECLQQYGWTSCVYLLCACMHECRPLFAWVAIPPAGQWSGLEGGGFFCAVWCLAIYKEASSRSARWWQIVTYAAADIQSGISDYKALTSRCVPL